MGSRAESARESDDLSTTGRGARTLRVRDGAAIVRDAFAMRVTPRARSATNEITRNVSERNACATVGGGNATSIRASVDASSVIACASTISRRRSGFDVFGIVTTPGATARTRARAAQASCGRATSRSTQCALASRSPCPSGEYAISASCARRQSREASSPRRDRPGDRAPGSPRSARRRERRRARACRRRRSSTPPSALIRPRCTRRSNVSTVSASGTRPRQCSR